MDENIRRRQAFVLTADKHSDRAISTESILQEIGFDVTLCDIIEAKTVACSNRLSMIEIYKRIQSHSPGWSYVFEDDLGMLVPITIDEIIQCEEISSHLFYLGCCTIPNTTVEFKTNKTINNHDVFSVSDVRCLHGLGIDSNSVDYILSIIDKNVSLDFLDMIIGQQFTKLHHTNVVRFDLTSHICDGHRGVIFQDRERFPSTWKEDNWE